MGGGREIWIQRIICGFGIFLYIRVGSGRYCRYVEVSEEIKNADGD
jgi:hypothetical protein